MHFSGKKSNKCILNQNQALGREDMGHCPLWGHWEHQNDNVVALTRLNICTSHKLSFLDEVWPTYLVGSFVDGVPPKLKNGVQYMLGSWESYSKTIMISTSNKHVFKYLCNIMDICPHELIDIKYMCAPSAVMDELGHGDQSGWGSWGMTATT